MTESTAEWKYEPVPPSASVLYRMLWQLETWLRTMVYVELKAARTDWEEPIKANLWANSLTNDKVQHHMATSHQVGISYLTFGQLWKIISDNRPMFEPYFPPEANTVPRMEEVKTIRNRIAHFREPHRHDVDRLKLFMKDMEAGIRKFCFRYCVGKRPQSSADEPVHESLETQWETIGYGIELHTPLGWLYAPGHLLRSPKLNATLELLTHKNYTRGSMEGVVYKLTFSPNLSGQFDVKRFVDATRDHHKDIIHILLGRDSHSPAVTIPAIHGVATTVDLISKFLSAALNSQYGDRQSLERETLNWPENILWPEHILSFFDSDITEPILMIDD